VAAALEHDGVLLLTAQKATRVEHGENASSIIVEGSGQQKRIECDAILCAVGRTPRVTGFGLEELGIPLRENRTIETDAYLQTLYPNVYACGDVAGPLGEVTHLTRPGSYPGRYDGRRARRRLAGGVRARHDARHRLEGYFRGRPHLSDACRGEQVRGRELGKASFTRTRACAGR